MKNQRINAFNLTELLVVLAITGILILIALPQLMPLISKAKSVEAQAQLNHIYTMQKSYFYIHSKYTSSFDDLNYEQAKLVTEGGNANYAIDVTEASVTTFKAKATAIVDFDGDGVFNVWEIDQNQVLTETTKD